jgi:fermentation-respiration switch protein FrsA (DUF1100 family)
MARRLYPFLPVRWITRVTYPAKENAKRFSSPVLVIHSQQDEIIPFDMGRSIFTAAPEPREFLEITGGHNDGFLINRFPYQTTMGRFLGRHMGIQNAVNLQMKEN